MELFGTTRSRLRRSHALIAPDSFVTSDLPGWERSQGIILISPRMGARFSQYLALMEPGGSAGQPPPRRRASALRARRGGRSRCCQGSHVRSLGPGGFAYCPPDTHVEVRATATSSINVFEKRYVIRPRFLDARPALRRRAGSRRHRVHGRPGRDPQGALAARPAVRPGRQRLHVSARDDAALGRGSCDGAWAVDAGGTRASIAWATTGIRSGRATSSGWRLTARNGSWRWARAPRATSITRT